MSTLSKLKKVLEVLEKNGVNMEEYVTVKHDVIYIWPGGKYDISFSEELEEAGAIYSLDGWVIYC